MDERSYSGSLRIPLVLLLLSAATIGACNGESDSRIEHITVDLEERNESGFSGTALLASAGSGEIAVVIAMGQDENEDEELGVDFPVAVNEGTCGELSGVEVLDLDRLSNGTLYSQVRGNLGDLRDRDHSIAVFSSTERSLYIACGDF